MPRGFTTLELVVVMTVFALITAISVPTVKTALDRLAVARATNVAATFIQKGRLEAVIRSDNIRLLFGVDRFEGYRQARVRGVQDSLLFSWPGPGTLGVNFTATRAEIRFQPTGIGHGAANTKLIFRRGESVDSLSTSILGRIRR